jgi:protein-tyrosine-phosphatase
MSTKLKVLFVCLGNICRSPIAHAIFLDKLNKLKLNHQVEVNSKGTANFHLGQPPDARCLKILKQHQIEFNHQASQICTSDLDYYDYILVMDHLNYEDVINLASNPTANQKVLLLRSFEVGNQTDFNVPDPYYSTEQQFDEVFHICLNSIDGFIQFLFTKQQLYLDNLAQQQNNNQPVTNPNCNY